MRWKVAVALVGVAVVAALAWRFRPRPVAPPRYPEIAARIVARVDADGDGVVSAAEYEAVALPDEPMDPWDEDGDGALSLREVERQFLEANPAELMRVRHEATRTARLRGEVP